MKRKSESPSPGGADDFHIVSDTTTPGRSRYRLVNRLGVEVKLPNEFLDALSLRGLSEETLRTYAYALLNLWRWVSKASLSINDLTELHLADYIRHLREAAGEKRPPAPRSINLRLLVARLLYRFHTDRELPKAPKTPPEPIPLFVQPFRVGTYAAPRLGRPSLRVKVPSRLIVALTRDEVVRFFESFQTFRDLGLVSLKLFCGLRSREVLALKLQDVNFAQETLHVVGKGAKDRVLPLAPYVRRALCSYLELERPETDHDVLFVNLKGPHRGKPMTSAGLRELFRYHRKRSGVEKANPHRFRHTFALDMIRERMPLPVLKRLMGHSNIEMTMRYINLTAEDVRAEFERAARRIARGSPDDKSLPESP